MSARRRDDIPTDNQLALLGRVADGCALSLNASGDHVLACRPPGWVMARSQRHLVSPWDVAYLVARGYLAKRPPPGGGVPVVFSLTPLGQKAGGAFRGVHWVPAGKPAGV